LLRFLVVQIFGRSIRPPMQFRIPAAAAIPEKNSPATLLRDLSLGERDRGGHGGPPVQGFSIMWGGDSLSGLRPYSIYY